MVCEKVVHPVKKVAYPVKNTNSCPWAIQWRHDLYFISQNGLFFRNYYMAFIYELDLLSEKILNIIKQIANSVINLLMPLWCDCSIRSNKKYPSIIVVWLGLSCVLGWFSIGWLLWDAKSAEWSELLEAGLIMQGSMESPTYPTVGGVGDTTGLPGSLYGIYAPGGWRLLWVLETQSGKFQSTPHPCLWCGIYQGVATEWHMPEGVGHYVGFGDPNFKVPTLPHGRALHWPLHYWCNHRLYPFKYGPGLPLSQLNN